MWTEKKQINVDHFSFIKSLTMIFELAKFRKKMYVNLTLFEQMSPHKPMYFALKTEKFA